MNCSKWNVDLNWKSENKQKRDFLSVSLSLSPARQDSNSMVIISNLHLNLWAILRARFVAKEPGIVFVNEHWISGQKIRNSPGVSSCYTNELEIMSEISMRLQGYHKPHNNNNSGTDSIKFHIIVANDFNKVRQIEIDHLITPALRAKSPAQRAKQAGQQEKTTINISVILVMPGPNEWKLTFVISIRTL